MRYFLVKIFVAFVLICGARDAVAQADKAEFVVPELAQPVMDIAGVFPRDLKDELERAIRDLQASGGSQISILIAPSITGETIESAAIKVADKWKLGSKGKDNGVLMIVAIQERKLRIEVGRGLEGQLTDLQSGRIIRNVIAPRFRDGQVGLGVIMGVAEIVRATDPQFDFGKYFSNFVRSQSAQGGGTGKSPAGGGLSSILFFIFFIFLMIVFSFISLVSRFLPGSSGISRRSGYHGGWTGGGGGFGGGGGWSGGGGGFGGGGASGDW